MLAVAAVAIRDTARQRRRHEGRRHPSRRHGVRLCAVLPCCGIQRPTAATKRTTDGARTPSASEAAANPTDSHSPAKPTHACVRACEGGGGGYEFTREGAGRKVCRDADRCGHRRELELHGTHPRAHMTTPPHGRLPFAAGWSAWPRRVDARAGTWWLAGVGLPSAEARNRTWHDAAGTRH